MAQSILLKNGTILAHDETDSRVQVLRNTDILITGNKIVQIGKDISLLEDRNNTTLIDCTEKIISPGFTDTHHHLWQTQLKGRHADETLIDYMVTGNIQVNNYTPEDIFWGQLSGAMEAIDVGTTFVLDHAHCYLNEKHAHEALSATVSSGLRSLFAGTAGFEMDKWDKEQCTIAYPPSLPDGGLGVVEQLAQNQPYGDGRVTIGLAFDSYYLGEDAVRHVFDRATKAGVRGITSHVLGSPMSSLYDLAPKILHNTGLLTTTPNLVLSHCTSLNKEDLHLLRDSHVAISSTPETEAQMGQGTPVFLLEPDLNISLGVDCHTNNTASIPVIARTGLYCARLLDNASHIAQSHLPSSPIGNTEQAFNTMTINGARAVGLHHEIGSIRVGKKADLVIFDTTRSTTMSCVSETDPLVAVVRHSDVRDVDTVIVDGVVRKREGVLCPVVRTRVVDDGHATAEGGEEMDWKEVRRNLMSSMKRVWERDSGRNHQKAREVLDSVLQIDSGCFV